MTTYFSKIKEVADNLSMADYFVSNDDFAMHLLQGLPLEHDEVIANINSHPLHLVLKKCRPSAQFYRQTKEDQIFRTTEIRT